jgi:hypothetical protein
MTQPEDRPPRRRRRPRRPAAEQVPGAQPAGTGSHPAPGAETARHPSEPGTGHRNDGGRRDEAGRGSGRESERGWRELAGSAPSQVGLGGALRARDVARPTAADLAAAERTVVVVRRQWQPPEG